MENLTFYGGFLLSKIDAEAEFTVTNAATGTSTKDKFDIEEDDLFGIFVGGDFNVNEQFNMGLEARLIHETSFSLK